MVSVLVLSPTCSGLVSPSTPRTRNAPKTRARDIYHVISYVLAEEAKKYSGRTVFNIPRDENDAEKLLRRTPVHPLHVEAIIIVINPQKNGIFRNSD